MKIKSIRDMSTDDLELKASELKKELLMLRIQRVNGRLEQSHLLSENKRDIAKILTVLTQKKGNSHV